MSSPAEDVLARARPSVKSASHTTENKSAAPLLADLPRRRGRPKGSTSRSVPPPVSTPVPVASPKRSRVVAERLQSREGIATILLTIVSMGTVLFTYFGVSIPLSEVGDGPIQKGLALSFAVTIGTISWLGWYFFGLTSHLRKGRLRLGVLANGLLIVMFAAIDGPLIMLALAGAPASQMSLVDMATYYEQQRTLVFEQTSQVRQLLPAIRANATRFAKLEIQEVETGAQSGKAGAGRVSVGIDQIATVLNALGDQLDSGLLAAEQLQSETTQALSVIKKQAYAQGPIRARMEAASNGGDRLDELLAQLSQYDYAVSIKATIDSLASIFPVPTSSSSDFETRQNGELALILAMAQPVAASLENALRSLPVAPLGEGISVRPLAPGDAIKRYWNRLLSEWVAAILVDIGPVLLLLILIAGRREEESALDEEQNLK